MLREKQSLRSIGVKVVAVIHRIGVEAPGIIGMESSAGHRQDRMAVGVERVHPEVAEDTTAEGVDDIRGQVRAGVTGRLVEVQRGGHQGVIRTGVAHVPRAIVDHLAVLVGVKGDVRSVSSLRSMVSVSMEIDVLLATEWYRRLRCRERQVIRMLRVRRHSRLKSQS